MRKLILSTTLAAILLASTGMASFAQDATAPAAGGGMAGMDGMASMPGMAAGGGTAGMSGGGAMPMGDMGMMPMMMAMMMPMPMGGGAAAGMPGAPAMAPSADQAGLETKLNLLISSIETLTTRINALEAKAAN